MKKGLLLCIATCCLLSVSAQAPNTSITNNGKVWASIYQQRAAEYKALCYQAYNIAKLRLDITLKQPHKKPLAVVTDIDETLLDNSPYDAKRAINNQGFDLKTWKEWTAKGICDTVPGAAAFFKYAASKKVAVFYITNRDTDEFAGTIKNLQLYNLPYADNEHLILKEKSSSKETRRLKVLATHKIVLLCGDNLPDFDALYDNHPTEDTRKTVTEKLRKNFGNKYIVIPNPVYADWESAIFQYNNKLSDAQKDSVIRAKIKLDE